MSPVALLDVNVLIALFDTHHVHHEAAHRWFAVHRRQGWATCPLTENAFVRVVSNPAYPGSREAPATLRGRLQAFCATEGHVFWPDGVSLRDEQVFSPTAPATHRLVTDVYLLGLATRQGGRLATFDRRIPLASVRGAGQGHLLVVPA